MRWLPWLLASTLLIEAAGQSAEDAGEKPVGDKILEFERWFRVAGGKAPGVEVFHSDDRGYGVRATRDVESEDEIITIPKELIFSRSAVLDSKVSVTRGVTPDLRNAFARITYDEDLISLLLLRERSLGNESFFWPYLSILPDRALPVPSTLSEERAKEMLDGPSFLRAKQLAKRRDDRYRKIRDPLRIMLHGAKYEKECTTLAAFVWADTIVASRALTIAKVGKFLMPFADLLNYRPHPETREHNHGAFFEQHHKMLKDSFSVFADRNTGKGAEVFEDYGDNDNELYFQAFAFTPSVNPFDCVSVRLPAPAATSKVRSLVRKLKLEEQPSGCLRPDRPLPDKLLHHLHLLSMPEDVGSTCLERAQANPEAGDAACFDQSYTLDSAWKKLQDVISQQLAEPKKAPKPFKEDETLKPFAARLADVQVVINTYAASREQLLRGLLAAPPPAPSEPAAEPEMDEAAVDEIEDLSQLHGLIAESTLKYLGALRAAANVSQQASRPWSEPVRSMFLTLHGEVGKILANPVGACGTVDDEPDVWPAVTDAAVAAFNEWFAGKMKMRDRPDLGDRVWGNSMVEAERIEGFRIGLVAQAPIAAEDVYLAAPASTVIDSKSALNSNIGHTLQEVREMFKRSDIFHDVLLHLWNERFVLREASDFWPYLSLLPPPDEFVYPHFCDNATLDAALGGSTLLPLIRAQRNSMRTKYEKWIAPVFKKVPFFRKLRAHMTFARYEWLTFTINSRSLWWQGERHLVPMLDFLNCKSAGGMRVHSAWPDEDGFAGARAVIAKASVAVEAGAQVLENYGQPNHVYFVSHGFVLEENEHDCYRWEQAPGRDTHCLSPREDLPEDFLTKIGGGYADKGREFVLDDLRRRFLLYPAGPAPAGAAGPEAAAYAFAATERRLLERLIAQLAEARGEL